MPPTDQPNDSSVSGTDQPVVPQQPAVAQVSNQQEANPEAPPVAIGLPNPQPEEAPTVVPPAPPDPPPVVQIVTPQAGEIAQVEVAASSAGGVDVKEDVQKLGPLPRAGLRLAMLVGTLIGVVTILVVIEWWRSAPGRAFPPISPR